MKKITVIAKFLLLCFTVISIISCKKETTENPPIPYSQIAFSQVTAKESNMVTAEILASNAAGLIWKSGDVIVYKTNENRYGKLEVIAIDIADNYKLTLRATTYKADGTVYKFSDGFTVAGTWSADMDAVAQTTSGIERDFHWSRQTGTDTYLKPYNNAVFVKF